MRAKIRLMDVAGALLEAQAGVASRSQLAAIGVTRRVQDRLSAEGLLTRVTTGVLSARGVPDWYARAWAGVLVGGEHAVLGFEAAAHLHGLIKHAPDEIAVFVGPDRHAAPRIGWRFLRTWRKGDAHDPPRTSVKATVVDLCGEADEDGIAALLADALSARATTAADLLAELAGRARHPHRRLLRDILGDVAGGADSALEWRFLTGVERAHGLPEATRQAHAHHKHRSDAWYSAYGLLVELDGKLHHQGNGRFVDMIRDNDHALQGITTLRFGWAHVTGSSRCETATLLGQVLMMRGWEGPITPCNSCRLMHAV